MLLLLSGRVLLTSSDVSNSTPEIKILLRFVKVRDLFRDQLLQELRGEEVRWG